jgi:hypothetical protein
VIEQVRIMGKEYRVEEVPESGLTRTTIGSCNERTLTISVMDSLVDKHKRETVLHEVLHALDVALATNLTEQQITALSSGLYALAQDDPDATRYMLGLDKKGLAEDVTAATLAGMEAAFKGSLRG